MSVTSNLEDFKSRLPNQVCLVAVTKTYPNKVILEAYEAGHRHFGENRVQELTAKAENLPKDIVWHMIGHLQTNKVKYVAPFVGLIHGVDSLKLLKVINKEAAKNHRIIPCLMQVHIARESTKFGFSEEELMEMFEQIKPDAFKNTRITGLMGMATFTDNMEMVKGEFQKLKDLFELVKTRFFKDNEYFCELSMGMSNDYIIAIEAGSTIIRVGSAIFGDRNG